MKTVGQTQLSMISAETQQQLFKALWNIGRRTREPNEGLFTVKLAHPKSERLYIGARLAISGIRAEDGSGYSWVIEGNVVSVQFAPDTWVRPGATFTGYYYNNGRELRGWIKPT